MTSHRLPTLILLLLSLLASLSIHGCAPSRVIVENGPVYQPTSPPPPPPPKGPPPWAPAHGHRAKYRYYYYPEHFVYFEPVRRLYFYYSGGDWQVSVSLPASIRIEAAKYVVLEMDSDRPYEYHSEVVKHYPPGWSEKSHKEHGKGKKTRD